MVIKCYQPMFIQYICPNDGLCFVSFVYPIDSHYGPADLQVSRHLRRRLLGYSQRGPHGWWKGLAVQRSTLGHWAFTTFQKSVGGWAPNLDTEYACVHRYIHIYIYMYIVGVLWFSHGIRRAHQRSCPKFDSIAECRELHIFCIVSIYLFIYILTNPPDNTL